LPTYRSVLEYDGTDFSGWQFQPKYRTVCGELEKTLAALFAETIKVTCAGRTDAGVHATGQVISFKAERTFPIERLALALNAHLPQDITARDAEIVEDGFSARHHAKRRIYEYVILNRRTPSATLRRSAHHVWRPIDRTLFERAAQDLIGKHDFVAFCGVLPDRGGTVRTILAIETERTGELFKIRVIGDGFLHRQIRITVGTLVEIATGQRPIDDIPRILASKDRREAGYTAAAAGLYLAGVEYPNFASYRPALVPAFEGR
jgi:tRNA pseudouridine38-40 synthase